MAAEESKSTAVAAADDQPWFQRPRSLTALVLALAFVVWAAFTPDARSADPVYNIKRGLLYAALTFITYCALQLRDGLFERPSKLFWRVVTAVFILYTLVLVFLLFQNTDDARQMMKWVDPELGVELPERDYAADCRLYTPESKRSLFANLLDTVLDEFILAHTFGWWVGTMMMRDYAICWCLSILFEFYEMTFEHWMANFKECWWDHLLLDIFICNALGIYLGMRTCRWLEMKRYDWIGWNKIPTLRGKAGRAVSQFTPASWTSFEWDIASSWRRFVACLFLMVAISVMMLNAFFLKFVLWVPPSNPLNVYRLLLWYIAGSYGMAEYYSYVSDPSCKKIGPRAWLGVANILLEVLVWLKHGRGMFTAPFPTHVKLFWGVFGTVLVVGSIAFFALKPKKSAAGKSKSD
eukprot:PLAT13641.1.p2 GENE.PLAT13641.1~~PLAT13641.1.p2  ORF type:complete len:420 (+),score=216.93 PLAT13641.1:38-1261(+)